MKIETKRAIAFIASSIVNKRDFRHVYDYGKSEYTFMSGSIKDGSIKIYDHKVGCFISGNLNSIFHYGNSGYINMRISGNSFNGYDFNSNSHFSGRVTGKSVLVYDYGESTNSNYMVG